jgi:hypothetical protein
MDSVSSGPETGRSGDNLPLPLSCTKGRYAYIFPQTAAKEEPAKVRSRKPRHA